MRRKTSSFESIDSVHKGAGSMKKAAWRFLSALVLGALVFSAALAKAEQVTVSGCVEAGVESGCLMISSGGRTYDVTSTTPAPVAGTYGTASGTVFDGATTCMQGTPLSPAKWREDRWNPCGGPSAHSK
jgi:hypothetical protein